MKYYKSDKNIRLASGPIFCLFILLIPSATSLSLTPIAVKPEILSSHYPITTPFRRICNTQKPRKSYVLFSRYGDRNLGTEDNNKRKKFSRSLTPSTDSIDDGAHERLKFREKTEKSTDLGFFDILKNIFKEEVELDQKGMTRRKFVAFTQLSFIGVLILNIVRSFIFGGHNDNDKVMLPDGTIVNIGPVDEKEYITYQGEIADVLSGVIDLKLARSLLLNASVEAEKDTASASHIIRKSEHLQPSTLSRTCKSLAKLAPLEESRQNLARRACRSIDESYDIVWTQANSLPSRSFSACIRDVVDEFDNLIKIILY